MIPLIFPKVNPNLPKRLESGKASPGFPPQKPCNSHPPCLHSAFHCMDVVDCLEPRVRPRILHLDAARCPFNDVFFFYGRVLTIQWSVLLVLKVEFFTEIETTMRCLAKEVSVQFCGDCFCSYFVSIWGGGKDVPIQLPSMIWRILA